MRDVLVISEEPDIFRMLSTALSHLPVHFTWVGTIDDASEIVLSERPDFVFFAVRDILLLNRWLASFKTLNLDVPFVCFTSHHPWEQRELLWMSGASEVVELPRLKKEFIFIIENIFSQRNENIDKNELSGNLSILTVVDLIHTFEENQKNGVVLITHLEDNAELVFNKGQLVNVRLESHDPIEAICRISVWRDGNFHFKMDKIRHTRKIKLDNQQIITECQNYINRRKKIILSLSENTDVYYVAPLLDYEQVSPLVRKFILFFKEGRTLIDFLDFACDAPLPLLSDIEKWIEKRWLVNNMDYKNQLSEQKKNENRSAVTKLMQKVFSKSEEMDLINYSTDIPGEPDLDDENFKVINRQSDSYFSDTDLLDTFITLLENA